MTSSSSRFYRLLAPCLVLSVLLLGGCSALDRTVHDGSTARKDMTTPSSGARRSGAAQAGAAQAQTPAQQQKMASAERQPAAPTPVQPPKETVKVALLAPLSGKSAPLGQAMVNAAQLAVFDVGGQGFELMPRDTGATPEGSMQAMRDAIGSGAKLVIGPLFAADVAAVKPIVEQSDLNMLALSTDVSLAAPGAYVMGFAPTPQVERVIAFAASKGMKRFAALVPSGPYGQIVSKAFDEAVRQNGGTVVAAKSANDLAALAAQKDQIDAILLPFGGAELRRIAGQLATAGFDPSRVKVLGTGLWDEPHLAQGQALLIGGWFPAAEPEARAHFMAAYQDAYGQPAPRLATLAYDATALAAVLIQRGDGIDRTALTNPSGFAGVDGLFRLTQSGQIERGLAVLEVTDKGSKTVDPAPSTFLGR